MATVNEKMTAIADAIRDKTGLENALTLDDMAEDIPKVYDAGKQAEYDEFWDMFQKNGSRTDYAYGFYGWDGSKLKPKYNIVLTGSANSVFRATTGVKSFPKHLEECGVIVDSSKATTLSDFFQASTIEEISEFDGSSSNTYDYMFSGCPYLKSIRKLKLKPNPTYGSPYLYMFSSVLETLIVEGGIGKNGFNVSPCSKLTHESLMSIINCLVDKTTDTSGTTWTVTLGSTNLAKLTDSEKAIATQKGWTLA